MKNARKYLALVLAILSVVSLLAGCGNSGDSEVKAEAAAGDSQTLIVYTARSESLNNAVIENFEADTGIHVEAVPAKCSSGFSPNPATPRAISAGLLMKPC